jgi:ribosomal L10-like protein
MSRDSIDVKSTPKVTGFVGGAAGPLRSALDRRRGLTVAQTSQLRREGRGGGGGCRVTKNTLAKRAFASTSHPASEQWLERQTALVRTGCPFHPTPCFTAMPRLFCAPGHERKAFR